MNLWNKYITNIEKMVAYTRAKFLEILGIKEYLWEESESHYHNQNNEELLIIYNTLPTRFK